MRLLRAIDHGTSEGAGTCFTSASARRCDRALDGGRGTPEQREDCGARGGRTRPADYTNRGKIGRPVRSTCGKSRIGQLFRSQKKRVMNARDLPPLPPALQVVTISFKISRKRQKLGRNLVADGIARTVVDRTQRLRGVGTQKTITHQLLPKSMYGSGKMT